MDKCFLGLHYTFIERKLSTGFWIIAIKFMFLVTVQRLAGHEKTDGVD